MSWEREIQENKLSFSMKEMGKELVKGKYIFVK